MFSVKKSADTDYGPPLFTYVNHIRHQGGALFFGQAGKSVSLTEVSPGMIIGVSLFSCGGAITGKVRKRDHVISGEQSCSLTIAGI